MRRAYIKSDMPESFEIAKYLGGEDPSKLSLFGGIAESEKSVCVIFYTGRDSSGTATYAYCWVSKYCIENIENLKMFAGAAKAEKAFNEEYESAEMENGSEDLRLKNMTTFGISLKKE